MEKDDGNFGLLKHFHYFETHRCPVCSNYREEYLLAQPKLGYKTFLLVMLPLYIKDKMGLHARKFLGEQRKLS